VNVYEATLQYTAIGKIGSRSLSTPEAAVDYLSGCFDTHPEQESFWVIGLNRKNYPKFRAMVTLGTVDTSLVHPREVLKPAILASSAAIIVAHNHPSGDPNPSSADIRVTKTLQDACNIIGIPLLDHVVVGAQDHPALPRFYSFASNGLL